MVRVIYRAGIRIGGYFCGDVISSLNVIASAAKQSVAHNKDFFSRFSSAMTDCYIAMIYFCCYEKRWLHIHSHEQE
jgi:hypothetical protein